MTVVSRAVPILALVASMSCGSGPKVHHPTGKDKPIPLLIWVESETHLSQEDTLLACEEWKAKGIRCFVVDDKLKSHIQVYASKEEKCLKNDKGTYTLATAWRGGRIVFNMGCFGKIGEPNRHKFRSVMVHEIGHHLGIWNHVPLDCKSEGVKKHPSGKAICGAAVMNPMYDKDIHFVTPVDALAFDVRDTYIAVVVEPLPDGVPGEPDCTYLDR